MCFVMKRFMMVVGLSLLASAANAGQWKKCDMTVKVTEHDHFIIQAEVLKVYASPQVECPKVGEVIRFGPETPDYQSELPQKNWPKVGRVIKMRYQYLDGECKDRGPCRIKHYPVLSR